VNKYLPSEHYLFSVEDPLFPSKFGQNPTTEEVVNYLNSQGEKAEILDGKYGTNQRSIMVHFPKNIKGLNQLAKDCGQESVLHSVDGEHKFHFLNGPEEGNIKIGKGTRFHKEEPEDFWTKIHTPEGPLYFSHNFDPADVDNGQLDDFARHHKSSDNVLGKAESDQVIQPPKHNEEIRQVADKYAASKGLTLNHQIPAVKVNQERAQKIAKAYDAMPHSPKDPETKSAYDALKKETNDQYQFIKNSGLKISRIAPGQENPYKNGSKDLFKDIKENNHIWFYPTESGYGPENKNASDHPLLEPTNEHIDGQPLLANDIFRIVHDYFGHAKEGHGFGPHGEENAWRIHKQMYSPLAARALTAETRGQNSWVNFGPMGEFNRANPAQTIYADQKAGLLPDWALDEESFGKSEDLQKMKELSSRPKQIKLLEGKNKGRIVNVINEDLGNMDIAPRPGSAPILGVNDEQLNVANWDKYRKHKVIQQPQSGQKIIEAKDLHPFMPYLPKQKKLVEGIDLKNIEQLDTGWTSGKTISGFGKNSQGKKVVVKGHMPQQSIDEEYYDNNYAPALGPSYHPNYLSTAQREGLYHNIAYHLMKLGKYVPTTSVVHHEGNHYSVMEKIPDAEHYEEDNPHHQKVLDNLVKNGDIEKLAIMNAILGNSDRHSGNYMISPKGLHLIDHGLTFNYHDNQRDVYEDPAYFKHAFDHIGYPSSIHPNTVKWLNSLDPKEFHKFFKKHQVPSEIGTKVIKALQMAKRMGKYKEVTADNIVASIAGHHNGNRL
jgi:hypothetical protein